MARKPMRRWLAWTLRIVGGLLLVLALLIGGIMWSAFGGTSDIQDGANPAPGVRVVKDGFVAVYVLAAGRDQVALIDAGNDKTGKALLAELAHQNLKPAAVAAIFLTHGHPDHFNAMPLFPTATVYALSADVPLVEGKAGSHGPLTRLAPVTPTGLKVTRELRGGDAVDVGSLHVEVFAVPGHTKGSAAYLADGVLFMGDSAGATKDATLNPAVWVASDDTTLNRASLHALAQKLTPRAKDIIAICPAHTGCVSGLGPLQNMQN